MKVSIDYLLCNYCEKVFTRKEHLGIIHMKQIPLAMAEDWVIISGNRARCPECFEKAPKQARQSYRNKIIGSVLMNQKRYMKEIKDFEDRMYNDGKKKRKKSP